MNLSSAPQLKRGPLGGPISTVQGFVVVSALACVATACTTASRSGGAPRWTMRTTHDGRVVILDSAVVGGWQVCFWYDSLTLETRHPRPNPHCGSLRVTGETAQFLADDASFSGFIVDFSSSTVPPCARRALRNGEDGTLIPDFYGSSVHLELPAFRYQTPASAYVIASGRVRGDSLVGDWATADSTCSGSGPELFVMSRRQ